MKLKFRISLLILVVWGIWGLIGLSSVDADVYPTKSVQIIVPWDAGGGSDVATRTLVNVTQKYFPKPLVVINRAGGAGTIGTAEMCKARPDGYTIGSTAWGPILTQPLLQKLPYTEKDFIVIMQTYYNPRVFCANSKRPYKTMKQLMDYVKGHPEGVKVGLVGVGATDHFAFLQLEKENQVKFVEVPLGGDAAQITAALGGHVDVVAVTSLAGRPLIEAGQLVALGVSDTNRFSELPNIPTLAEQGYPVESGVANYIVVPKGVPQNIIRYLHDVFKKGMDDPGYLEAVKKMKYTVDYLSPEASNARLEKFRKLYSDLAEKMGIKEKYLK